MGTDLGDYAEMGEVRDKRENYALYNSGRFGNKLLTWRTLEEALGSSYQGPFAVRYSVPGSPFCVIGVSREGLRTWVRRFEAQGADRRLMQFSEGIIGERPFQGEVRRSENYYDLTYTTEEGDMRTALRKSQSYASGLNAVLLLRRHLPAGDYDWLQEIFDEWPDAIVEFSTFDTSVGNLGRYTIFWEVRNY